VPVLLIMRNAAQAKTPLHTACCARVRVPAVQVIRALLQAGACIDAADSQVGFANLNMLLGYISSRTLLQMSQATSLSCHKCAFD